LPKHPTGLIADPAEKYERAEDPKSGACYRKKTSDIQHMLIFLTIHQAPMQCFSICCRLANAVCGNRLEKFVPWRIIPVVAWLTAASGVMLDA
jgi:hypothetical protein